MPYHFLDMELCDLNLEKFIEYDWKESSAKRISGSLVNVVEVLPILRLLQIREIMKDMTRGLAYIHSRKEIHRDLTPRNGNLSWYD
jgi:serine/threonine protein kinase